LQYRFEIAEFRKHILLEGLDDIGLTLKYESKIADYETSHRPGATMYTPVDAKYASRT
jgi:3-isopropylmalate/(R)-2-methylmalate dehydratase small subunit